jgi:hypothetical protein
MNRLALRALRATVWVEAPDQALALIRRSLPELIAEGDLPAPGTEMPLIAWEPLGEGWWRVSLGDGGSIARSDTSNALAETISEINRLAARSVVDDHTVLHAGSFCVDGRAVAVTGVSGAGKSTLVAAATLSGLGYLGDEVCAVDPSSLRVRPFARPIGLRSGGAAAIGIEIPDDPLDPYREVYPWQPPTRMPHDVAAPLALIALVERRPGNVEIDLLRPAHALVRLTELSLAADRIEREVFRRLDRLVREVPVVTIFHDDPTAAADALAARVRRSEKR